MRVLVGLSGGVDSTIAAYILKKKGYEVVGAHFIFVGTSEHVGASSASPKEIAKMLGIEFIERDFTEEFRERIIKFFVKDYENGITPNPCALCNGTMKFQKLLEVMQELKCDMMATGHYANVSESSHCMGELCEPYYITKSKNTQKDQSYMLYTLTQDQLSHLILPIGDMSKDEVRDIARELKLDVAEKKDSQDVCFINEALGIDYKEFIKRYEFGDDYKDKIARGELKELDIKSLSFFKPGEFVDTNGNVLGYHKGIINYTIGQRKGLNIAFGERKFVKRIDAVKNQVVLADNDDLLESKFKIKNIVFQKYIEKSVGASSASPESNVIFAKVRYRHDGTRCKLEFNESKTEGTCFLEEPVRAITPGQAAVFYDDEGNILLGGTIY